MNSSFVFIARPALPRAWLMPGWVVVYCTFLWLHQAIAETPPDPLAVAAGAFERGDYQKALAIYQDALVSTRIRLSPPRQITALLGLASISQAFGQNCSALEHLQVARMIADKAASKETGMRVQAALGNALLLARRLDEAEPCLRKGLELARDLKDQPAQAGILQNLANLLSVRPHYPPKTILRNTRGLFLASEDQPGVVFVPPQEEGLKLYGEALQLARSLGDGQREAQVLINQARTVWLNQKPEAAVNTCAAALKCVRRLADARKKAFYLAACGRLYADLSAQVPGSGPLLQNAREACAESAQLAEQAGDWRTASYASGFLGELDFKADQFDSAMALSLQALFLAQKSGSDDARFEWEWQIARIERAQGKRDRAIEVYRQAVQTVQAVRGDLAVGLNFRYGNVSFRQSVGQVCFELADLLLARADELSEAVAVQKDLFEARQAVELIKTAEIEDYYFEDDCVSLMRGKTRPLDQAMPKTAVIYIIPLAKRIELLLTLPSGLRKIKSPVAYTDLAATVRLLRSRIDTDAENYLEPASQLYQWLIRPIEPWLREEQIQTLVFVPDGALRTIPMAVLHDGQKFLLERFAIAVAPGLTLMEPKPLPHGKLEVLTCGVSQAVEKFPALESVPRELASIQKLFGGVQLLDEAFSTESFERQLSRRSFPLIHIASHGQFGSDASKTFLLAHNGKITLDRLEQLILPHMLSERPIELLTLSACQTAAGDDRAALGLAGVAVKSGARSALATLWYVNDEAAQRVMTAFYTLLKNQPELSKAAALQKAQLALWADPRFKHPCYWAPYLLIGNWF